jgi:hypothetical protein
LWIIAIIFQGWPQWKPTESFAETQAQRSKEVLLNKNFDMLGHVRYKSSLLIMVPISLFLRLNGIMMCNIILMAS